MRRLYRVSDCAVLLVAAAVALSAADTWGGEKRLERGRALFERTWAPTHQQHPEADGLGPVYNERSCQACHSLGGIGGAGPIGKNIDLLSPTTRPGEMPPDDLVRRLNRVHPAFKGMSSIVLHKFSTDAEPYQGFRRTLLDLGDAADANSPPQLSKLAARLSENPSAPQKTIDQQELRFVWSQRNTTPLFGLGRIGRISDAEMQSVAFAQRQENAGVSGRFTGRFGWRGQIDELGEFVRSACATELGLNVGTHPQGIDPLQVSGSDKQERVSRKVDLTQQQCSDLTAYVAALPAPRRIVPETPQQIRLVEQGELVFNRTGCASCHQRKLGQIVGLYSDLLVHEMGERLSDPSPAPVMQVSARMQGEGGGGAYGGATTLVVQSVNEDPRREWKTPPLWGVRDSGPYLHDGRAETIEAAVLYHDGEATDSVKRFRELSTVERAQMLAFLGTLAAPDPAALR